MPKKALEGSLFYRELQQIIESINAEGGEDLARQTYRDAVVNGLALADSFCGKIKTGQYTPTLDRIEALADYLNVPPYSFTEYMLRIAERDIKEDPEIQSIFKVLARMTPKQAKIVKSALSQYADEIADDLEPKSVAAA